jgi:chromosome segregation and condensation protein ScpB
MAFKVDDRVAIERAIATGELTVRFADRTVTYRSMSELLKALETINADLVAQSNAWHSRVSRIHHAGKGWYPQTTQPGSPGSPGSSGGRWDEESW